MLDHTLLKFYTPPHPKDWKGRDDDLGLERVWQIIKLIDLTKQSFPTTKNGYALIGFKCDEGVKRNQGRPGAKKGPEAFRAALNNLTIHKNVALFDIGDISCDDGDMEAAQAALGKIVAMVMESGSIPLVVGGGHELAWGQYQGIAKAKPKDQLSILNFDAHFDIRSLINGKGSSGTPFLQIYNFCQEHHRPYRYTVAGIQQRSNTVSLFKKAKEMGVTYILAEDIKHDLKRATETLEKLFSEDNFIYLSICLDVFSSTAAPGVSAPSPMGLDPWDVHFMLKQLLNRRKVCAIGIAELSPPLDNNDSTAKLAAALFISYLEAEVL